MSIAMIRLNGNSERIPRSLLERSGNPAHWASGSFNRSLSDISQVFEVDDPLTFSEDITPSE